MENTNYNQGVHKRTYTGRQRRKAAASSFSKSYMSGRVRMAISFDYRLEKYPVKNLPLIGLIKF